MTKQRIKLLIPVGIIICSILFTWYSVLVEGYGLHWQHHAALIGFIPVLCFVSRKQDQAKALVATTIYLLLATFNVFYLQGAVYKMSIGVGDVPLPSFNFLSLFWLILFMVLNGGALMDVYLDYKEKKHEQSKNSDRPV